MVTRVVLRDGLTNSWLIFENPVDVLVASSVAEVGGVLADTQRRVDENELFAAGYLSYEAAEAFDKALPTQTPGELPLACFGLFDAPGRLDELPSRTDPVAIDAKWEITTSRRSYLEKIAAIKHQIELGNCYQVNLTIRQQASIDVDPWDLFCNVAIGAPYAAYLEFDSHCIVSASPELFFSLRGRNLTCRPMKGTAERAMTTADDLAVSEALQSSAKNRAENVMITDMIRNDMGRVAVAGSVNVDSLFDLEKYPTVWQMTSSVSATTDAEVPGILGALFPCASVTGAPKSSSMGTIAELEDSPREVYTGAIGYSAPSRTAQFSVAIRTAWIDKRTKNGTYGIGGGIVWDSDPDDEYLECIAKSKVLNTVARDRQFELLETMLWTASDGYFLFEEHVERLLDSATYFDFRCERSRVTQQLEELANRMHDARHRVRLRLAGDGAVSLEEISLADSDQPVAQRIRLACDPINVRDPFLFHKTTNRTVYERALSSVANCDDVLLWNPDGFITESTIANVIVQMDGATYTPPVSCGLLAGTYRNWLLRNGQVEEREIHIDELADADRVTLVNSVRGQYPATLCALDEWVAESSI